MSLAGEGSADEPESPARQLEVFRSLPGDLAARDLQDLMAYPFFSRAKSKRIAPIVFNTNALLFILVATEILRAASQIVQYRRGA